MSFNMIEYEYADQFHELGIKLSEQMAQNVYIQLCKLMATQLFRTFGRKNCWEKKNFGWESWEKILTHKILIDILKFTAFIQNNINNE